MNPKATESHRDFRPRGLLAGRHVQSILTSGPWRRRRVRRRANAYLKRSQRAIIEAHDGTRLLGFRNEADDSGQPRRNALVVLLHGWEGSVDSNYLLSAATSLDRAGFDTFRLNMRDHGESHHLNEDLFHSCRLQEMLDCVGSIRDSYERGPVFLVGFSLGGNFALRIARQAPVNGFDFERVLAISPVVRPSHVLDALERGLSLYQAYFVRKWRRSLTIKQALYPDRFSLHDWFQLRDLRSQTAWLVEHETEFPDLNAYLEGYSVAGDFLDGLTVPTRIITAADDPIIPVADVQALPRPSALDVEILARGGHCGFIENWRMDSWIEHRLIKELCPLTPN
jgi:predicted alpha/beta-fold hydrolase